MILNSLLFMFDADVSKLIEGEQKANTQTEKLQKNISETDNEAQNLGNTLSATIATMAGALASLISVGALTSSILQAKDYTLELDRTAESMGLLRNELGSLNAIIEQQGGNLQGLAGSLDGLNEKVVEASKGEGEFADFFKRFGINLKDAQGHIKSTTDILPLLADSFERMGKVESFSIGRKMGLDEATIRTLQLGRAELEANLQKQKQLFQITDKQVEAFQKYDKSLKTGQASFRDLSIIIGADIIPVFTFFMDKVNSGIDFVKEHPDLVKGVFIALATAITAYALPAIINFGIASITAFAPFYLIGAVIAGVAVAIGALYEDISIFLEGGNSAFEDLLRWIGATDEEVQAFRQAFIDAGKGIADTFQVLIDLFQTFLNLLFQGGKAILGVFEPIVKLFAEGFIIAIKTVLGYLSKLGDVMKDVKSWFGFGDDVNVEMSKKIEISNNSDKNSMKESLIGDKNSMKESLIGDKNLNKESSNNKDFSFLANEMGSNPINKMNSNTISNSNKNVSSEVKIDKIEIQTQATDSGAISKDIGNNLTNELNRVNANYEDGILS